MRSIYILLVLLVMFPVFGFSGGETETENESGVLTSLMLEEIINGSLEDYILIDVRTKEEYAGGYIPTAINIPYDVIADNLPTDNKDAKIIVYCRSGRRSSIADNTLTDLGYTNVVDFGGVSNWEGELAGD